MPIAVAPAPCATSPGRQAPRFEGTRGHRGECGPFDGCADAVFVFGERATSAARAFRIPHTTVRHYRYGAFDAAGSSSATRDGTRAASAVRSASPSTLRQSTEIPLSLIHISEPTRPY